MAVKDWSATKSFLFKSDLHVGEMFMHIEFMKMYLF